MDGGWWRCWLPGGAEGAKANMKGHSTPNGAAADRRNIKRGGGGGGLGGVVFGGCVHPGLLLFVLTALTLTSLITPTEQLTVAPNGTTLQQVDPAESFGSSAYAAMAADFYRRTNGTLNGTLAAEGRAHLNHRLRPPQENGSQYLDYDDDSGPDCSYSYNFVLKLITMILYALVCIIGLFGNTLVIYVVMRFSKMQTVTNIYILNLAIADECFLIGIPFLLYTMQVGNWSFGNYMCKAYMVSTSITSFTSSIFLLIMSADRYIAVCHPISSPRYRTPFVSKLVSAFAWMTSVLLMLPVILFASTVQSSNGNVSCNIEWPDTQNSHTDSTFILYSLVLGFATPLTFILVFYCLVIRKLHTVGPKHKSKEKKRSHRKVTKLVLTVISAYIFCWLPHWISQVALISSAPQRCASRLELAVFLACGCLSYSNSAMNPILYAFLSDNFKKSFMKACTCAARKDVNAQLQLENSFFPKFGKGRQSERLLGGGGKGGAGQRGAMAKKKALAARNNNAPMATTTTTTTTTAAGTDAVTCLQPAVLQVPAEIQVGGSPATVLVVNAETNNCKPPVLHTDL
ncbi:somatostatin receptor type 2 [Drosophila ficusphila]|uniref:somatostatin receptor type 2 n=1 Tax=Drosophila ficusphila TaxID=30025 RepID=UPI0007E63770|nr:somatostatin receptor type 2 [Drosophila ficusphila]XP_017059119.1 somatostatin receptor type 2 [Drosophila ficusphila]